MTVLLESLSAEVKAAASPRPRIADFLLAVAHLPLVATYHLRLWELPHYQFFPLALLRAFLLSRRATSTPHAVDEQTPFAAAAWGFGLSLLAAAVLFDSPWLGATAAMVNWSAWQVSRRRSWSDVLPAAAMIAVKLRPPLGIDTWLIHRLQRIAARAADATLDVLGVLHTLAGNVIKLPESRLLVEEACSGVNSLFSSAAAVLFYLLWNRRGWISSGLLCLSIPLWVVFTNVIRVVAVAVLRARWDIAADTGALHTALGLATFALAVGMILSTELRIDQGNSLLLARMLTASRTDGLLGEAARRALQDMIAVGELPAAAYLLLGTDAYERGERETAERYLKQALRLDPQSAVALNNLAWTLFNSEKPDLNAALASSEAALSLAPNDPHFRDTRFRILARQEQWERALEDLEFCTATMKGDREFHRTAAAVYDKLKLPAPVAEHLRLAGER